jgi:UDP-D-galactose:(glucosyl)LPS alpha-1,3-D-galactosyltransferase
VSTATVEGCVSEQLAGIVCGIDDGYAMPLRTLMRSIAASHGESTGQLRLTVLDQGVSVESRTTILRDATQLGLSTRILAAPAPDPGYPVSGWVSEAVYARLSIPLVVHDEDRVLYLDADTIVLGDLRSLLRRPLHGHPIGAVLDAHNPLIGHGIAMPGWEALGVARGRTYFNSGVMLIDVAESRRLRLFENAQRFLCDHPDKVRFWDQDALNYAAAGDWQRLEARWNTFAVSPLASRPGFVHHAEATTPLAQLIADERTASVIHFAGRDKPWNAGYPSGRLRDLYRGFQPATDA